MPAEKPSSTKKQSRNAAQAPADAAASDAPRTLDELRELVARIQRGELDYSLGTKAMVVLAELVRQPEQVATRSITELATNVDVNASTLTRVAKRLGYMGFVDFQAVFRQEVVRGQQHFYSEQAQRLLGAESHRREQPELATFFQLAQESAANIDGFLRQLSAGELRKVATLLARAPHVRLHGVRQFYALTSFLAYGLSLIRPDVSLLDESRMGVAESLACLQRGDVLVVASCAPYTRSVADVAAAAAAHGVTVIALTDTHASPLVRHADHSFFIPHASSFFSNSMGAYVVFCEGLLNLIATTLGKKALMALGEREQLIAEMGIEVS